MHLRASTLAALLLALTASGAAAAQTVYKWVDEHGVTHYSHTPPTGGPAETISLSALESAAPSQPVDYRTILERARELEAARLARERERAQRLSERRAADLQAARAEEARARAEYWRRREAAPPVVIVRPRWLPHRPRHGHKDRPHEEEPKQRDWRSGPEHPRHDFGPRSTHDAPLHGQRN